MVIESTGMHANMAKIVNAGILGLTISALVVLSLLTPAPSGIGTHQQIIPVPCLFRLVIKIPCPSCGLTTSVVYLLHGDIINSIKAHLLGLLFMMALMAILFTSIIGMIKNRAWWKIVEKRWFQNTALYGIGLYLGVWIIRLMLDSR